MLGPGPGVEMLTRVTTLNTEHHRGRLRHDDVLASPATREAARPGRGHGHRNTKELFHVILTTHEKYHLEYRINGFQSGLVHSRFLFAAGYTLKLFLANPVFP